MKQRLAVFGSTFAFWLAFGWLARLLFLAFHHSKTGTLSAGEIAMTFGAGLRLDLSAAAYLTLVPTLLLVPSGFRAAIPIARAGAWLWTVVVAAAGALLVTIDLEAFRHWDRRIDAMLLTYLSTPREAWASAGGSPRLLLSLLAVALGVAVVLSYRRTVARAWQRIEPIHPLRAALLILLIGPLFLAGRGGWQEIALTQSSAYFSGKPFANFAAQNPLWGFFDSMSRRLDDSVNHFRSMDPEDAASIVATARRPVAATVAPPVSVRRPNILVIVWESGAAPAFGSTGGLAGVTPRFDSLRREGILFRNMYAAGDRTDKGVTAVLSGFPGLPNGSIMKVPAKARSLPMLSGDLRQAGYRTSFYYGGELEFASMQAYLYEAGFDRIVGKSDFPRSSWNSKWGAHDGVVAQRVLDDLSRRTDPEPFFAVWLTLSSHEPFETPTPPRFPGSGWRERYLSSMAYTDEVLGALVDSARTRDWWDDTLVVIVSDHGRRVAEQDPAFRDAEALFHIPMLWLGGALTTRDSVVTTIASQLDVAPTLVDLTGAADPERYRWGRSLLRPTSMPYAFYAFEQGFGLVTDRGYLVYDHRAGAFPTRVGLAAEPEEKLGRALLQLTYQSYLDLGRPRAGTRPAN